MSIHPTENGHESKPSHAFRRFAESVAHFMGSPKVFCLALFLIICWATSGFYFGFNDTWQLLINTATTIITFLMVLLIQNTQNRHAKSTHLKLNELLLGTKNTRNSLMEIEEQSDEEMEELDKEFRKLRAEYILQLEKKLKKKKKNLADDDRIRKRTI